MLCPPVGQPYDEPGHAHKGYRQRAVNHECRLTRTKQVEGTGENEQVNGDGTGHQSESQQAQRQNPHHENKRHHVQTATRDTRDLKEHHDDSEQRLGGVR